MIQNEVNNVRELPDNQAQDGIRIDFKRVLFRAIQFWYLLVICLGVSLTIAFFKNRYAVRIYPMTASFLIKQKENTSEGRLLYNNPLVSGFRNYLDEIYIIRSYPLIERTIEDLGFTTFFSKEGKVLITEEYDAPVEAQMIDKAYPKSLKLYFKVLNDHQFQLMEDGDAPGPKDKAVFSFNDTIKFQGAEMIFFAKPRKDVLTMKGEFLFNYVPANYLVGSYVGRLRASWAEEGSGVINISIDGSNPRKEIDFLTGLIDHYQANDLEKKNIAATRTVEFITDQLAGISDSLHGAEIKLERFKIENVTTELGEKAKRLFAKLEPLETSRSGLMLQKSYYKYLTDYLKRNDNLEQVILPSSMGIEDKILSDLISQMIDIQQRLRLNTKLESPLITESRKKLNEIRSDVLESVRNQESADAISNSFLSKQIKEIEDQLNGLPLAERRLVSIQRNYSLLENLYIFLLQKRAEAEISKASTTSDIEIVNPPRVAGGPIYPTPNSSYIIAVLLGLGLPAALFIILEVFNTKVQSKEDVEKITGMPFIGGVGHKQSETNLEVLKSPKSAIAESFRALRSNLSYFLGAKENAVFLITSSISGEGKTFTSVNLASVFALSGKRTLIVGADLRRPKIFYDFQLNNEIGLSNYLAGLNGFDEIVQGTNFKFLDMVSGGPVPPNPSELLLTHRMEEFVNEAKKRYDYVIIDTPPLGVVTDAFVLSRYADHTLFLIRQNYTPKALLRTVNDFYATGKLKNISIVLNDIYKTGPGYGYGYGYNYGYGYGYYYGKRKKKGNANGYYSE